MSKLKNEREKKGLSQAKLADKSGVYIRNIQMWEQGHRNIDHSYLENILKIAIALECKIEDIVGDNLAGLYNEYKKRTAE